ncbi:MAG: aldo/keto reductase [Caldisericaceae bacterium]|nr:aldo/keto reductase [Caldisericaceae bacterium]
MKYRTFDKSDVKISRLGVGTWGMGKTMWIGADDAESKRVLHKAIEEGINFFDSAFVYGMGHSEKLLGEVEKEAGKTLFITTKIPPKNFRWPAKDSYTLEECFPTDYIIQTTEKSLLNLKRDYLDLQQFHVWSDAWADRDEWKDAIVKLKDSGKVRFFGISMNDHEPTNGIEAAKSGLIDSFQVIFNLFDQAPIDQLFPFCLENNISVIARVPFDEGALTGNIIPETTFPPKDFRNRYFRGDRKEQVWQRVQEIMKDVADETESLPEAALRFVISFEAVTTVIPGVRKMEHLLSNIKAVEKGALSEELIQKLARHRWIRNFYQ